MSLSAPTNDFVEILGQIGQTISIRKFTRTIDINGNVTAVSTIDTDIVATVQEIGYKEKLYLQALMVNIGDTLFFVAPDNIITIYDQIIYNATTFKIRKVLIPPRINGQILYKQVVCVQDSGAFPT